MDYYPLLRLGHIVGFVLLGGGLLAVFVSELRAYRTSDVHRFAEAAWYTATFYDALVLPGAVLVAVSGLLLIFELGLGIFGEPWLVVTVPGVGYHIDTGSAAGSEGGERG